MVMVVGGGACAVRACFGLVGAVHGVDRFR